MAVVVVCSTSESERGVLDLTEPLKWLRLSLPAQVSSPLRTIHSKMLISTSNRFIFHWVLPSLVFMFCIWRSHNFFVRCLSPVPSHTNASTTSITQISVLCPALCLSYVCMRKRFFLNDDLDVKQERKYIVF